MAAHTSPEPDVLMERAREAARRAFAPYSHFPVGAALVDAWRGLSPRLRTAVADAVVSRPDRAVAFLDAVESGRIARADVDAGQQDRHCVHAPNLAGKHRRTVGRPADLGGVSQVHHHHGFAMGHRVQTRVFCVQTRFWSVRSNEWNLASNEWKRHSFKWKRASRERSFHSFKWNLASFKWTGHSFKWRVASFKWKRHSFERTVASKE